MTKPMMYGIRINDSSLLVVERNEARAVIAGAILAAQAFAVNVSAMKTAGEILNRADALPDGEFLTYSLNPVVDLRVTSENGAIPR